MKYIVISLGFLFALAGVARTEPECHLSLVMQCAAISIDWLHSLPASSIPNSEEDVDKMCQEFDETFNCLMKYRDECMTVIQKELIELVLEGIITLKDDFCTTGSDSRNKYLSHSTCLNKVSQSDEVKGRINYILAVLEKLPKVKNSNKVMYACCGYSKIYGGFKHQAIEMCGQEATAAAEELIGLAVAQLPSVLCNGVNGEGDTCKSLLPPEGSKPSDDVKGSELYKFLHHVLKNWLD